jgi:hypothetical protein
MLTAKRPKGKTPPQRVISQRKTEPTPPEAPMAKVKKSSFT